jgi:hypothetical protein
MCSGDQSAEVGNPAVLVWRPRTRSFASPPLDGFAFSLAMVALFAFLPNPCAPGSPIVELVDEPDEHKL